MEIRMVRINNGNVVAYASLASILLLTLLLRLYGIDWGLPTQIHPDHSYHPDETALLTIAQWMAQGGLHVKEFIYGGTLYFVLLRACIYFGDVFRDAIGGANTLANAILTARYFQVFIALVTILVVYECGRLLYDRKTGLVAALILAVSPAHIIATQTVRPDAISAFLVTVVMFTAAQLLKSENSGRASILLYSGVAIGALAAFRLPLAAFGLLPFFGYIKAKQRTSGGPIRKLLIDRNLAMMAVVVVLTYAALSPHTFIYPDWFLAGLKMTAGFETTQFPDAVDRGPVFFQYGWRLFRQALGYPAYLLALLGIVYAMMVRRAEDMVVLIGVGLYFAMLAAVTWTVVRYTLPVLPLLALLGGVAVIRTQEMARHFLVRMVVPAIAAIFFGWTLMADLALLHVVASKNVRTLSGEWIAENIPRDKSIVVIKNYLEDNFFNPSIPSSHRVAAEFVFKGNDNSRLFVPGNYDYVVLHEMFYSDIERLGERHPQQEIRDFYANWKRANMGLVKEWKIPFRFLGIDFSGSFTAMDFSVINPGIRVYRAPDGAL